MPMKSMKVEKKDTDDECCVAGDNVYGYGLTLYLDEERLKSLGFDAPLEVGSVVSIEAKGFVETASMSADKKGKRISMSIQITDLGIEGGEKMDTANILYKGE